MGNLIYTKEATGPLKLSSELYEADSIYSDADMNKRFLQLKANVCGSGVKSIVIKDDSGRQIASGVSSVSYTLGDSYQGLHT